ncbi:ComEC/Rec2 family competence protein [Paracoccus suum]|uniref:ComEC/Rec2 family competence protein n=1 Tax=Paracoccus suum TaxID=2259340 RepID=UPI0013B05F4C|nr:ComEC/Rec2 family competence protein [Paracoccus suum]
MRSGSGTLTGVVLAPYATRPRAQAAAPPARPSALARAGWFPWLPVWLAFGIGLWFALPVEPGPLAYALAGVTVLGGLGAWWRVPRLAESGALPWAMSDGFRLAGLALAVAAAGFAVAGIRSAQVAAPILGWRYHGPIEGRLVEVDRSARDRIRLTLDQVALRDLAPSRTPRRVRLSLGEEGVATPIPPPGTRVMTTGYLGPPPGPAAPGSFDFRRQAWFEGLGAIGYTRNPVMVAEPSVGGAQMWLQRLRQRMSLAMQQAIGGQEGAVASALMTGDRSGIAEATNAVMRDANLYHIVSISGLHMSMLAGFIYGALRIALSALSAATGRGAGRPVHKLAAGVALAAAAFYMALSDGGVATERAFVMIAVMLGAIIVDRRAISLRTVALAALILLVLSPEALTQPGFQMSFAATVGLILSAGPWSRVSPRVPRLLRPVAMLLLSSAVAGFATAPLAAAHFNRMSEYGLLANLLAVPLMGAVVMPGGVIAALLAPVGFAQPALWIMGIGTGLMLDIARFISGLHGAVSTVPSPPGAVIPLLGLGGVLLALGGGGLGLPHGMVRGIGAAVLTLAMALWLTATRPALLIAAEADAVGLLTPAGRTMSKPKGGSFAVATWLAEDGDIASSEAAGNRAGWSGPAGVRTAQLPNGRTVVHLTGKGAEDALAATCKNGGVVVAAIDDRPRGSGERVPSRGAAQGQGGSAGTAKAAIDWKSAANVTRTGNKEGSNKEARSRGRDTSAGAEKQIADCQRIDLNSLRLTGAVAISADGSMRTVRDAAGDRPWSGRAKNARPRFADLQFRRGGRVQATPDKTYSDSSTRKAIPRGQDQEANGSLSPGQRGPDQQAGGRAE